MPNAKGGLGIKNIYLQNDALLTKNLINFIIRWMYLEYVLLFKGHLMPSKDSIRWKGCFQSDYTIEVPLLVLWIQELQLVSGSTASWINIFKLSSPLCNNLLGTLPFLSRGVSKQQTRQTSSYQCLELPTMNTCNSGRSFQIYMTLVMLLTNGPISVVLIFPQQSTMPDIANLLLPQRTSKMAMEIQVCS